MEQTLLLEDLVGCAGSRHHPLQKGPHPEKVSRLLCVVPKRAAALCINKTTGRLYDVRNTVSTRLFPSSAALAPNVGTLSTPKVAPIAY
jgi:hypothetical protein